MFSIIVPQFPMSELHLTCFHFQGTVLFWDDKPRGKGKEREIFLFEKVLINARKREDGKRYTCKNVMKVRKTCDLFITSTNNS